MPREYLDKLYDGVVQGLIGGPSRPAVSVELRSRRTTEAANPISLKEDDEALPLLLRSLPTHSMRRVPNVPIPRRNDQERCTRSSIEQLVLAQALKMRSDQQPLCFDRFGRSRLFQHGFDRFGLDSWCHRQARIRIDTTMAGASQKLELFARETESIVQKSQDIPPPWPRLGDCSFFGAVGPPFGLVLPGEEFMEQGCCLPNDES